MKPLPPNYDERTLPRCETEPLYAFGDAVAAVALTGGAVAVAVAGHDTESGTSKWVGVVGLGLAAVAFTASSVGGFRWDKRCNAAKKQWDQRQIEQDTLVQQSKLKQPLDTSALSPPRGFYCASSPTTAAGFCMREKAECERTRDTTAIAIADLTQCMLTEAAWCFDDRCAPTRETCRTMLERAQSSASDCAEAK